MRSTRRTKLKRNNRGHFAKEIGYTNPTLKKQPKFNLGNDECEADKRAARIQELFADCQRATGQPTWTPFGLYAAKLIAKGTYQIPYPLDSESSGFEEVGDICADYVQLLRTEQARYPSIQIVPDDGEDGRVFAAGVDLNRQLEEEVLSDTQRRLVSNGVVPTTRHLPNKFISGSLHEALDVYARHVEMTGGKLDDQTLKPSQRKRIEYVEGLKQHHRDCPLMNLTTYDAIHELISYWANRPEYKPGKRYKPTTARHRRKELERFFRWLDLTSEFDWEMPRGADSIRVTTTEIEEDHANADLLSKLVYTPEQLALLASMSSEFEKLMLLVGVNCAFGAAEIGRLIATEVLFDHVHEFAHRLDFKSTSQDCFIRLNRPKTKMFGEWLLWPETASVLRWATKRSAEQGTPFLFVTKDGNRIYNEKCKNPQSATANRWTKLVRRVQKSNPDFPYLPFGSLRDTLPDTLRRREQDTLASISLAHKTSFKADNLLEAYGNKPFGRLHDAIRDLAEHFAPMLEASRR